MDVFISSTSADIEQDQTVISQLFATHGADWEIPYLFDLEKALNTARLSLETALKRLRDEVRTSILNKAIEEFRQHYHTDRISSLLERLAKMLKDRIDQRDDERRHLRLYFMRASDPNLIFDPIVNLPVHSKSFLKEHFRQVSYLSLDHPGCPIERIHQPDFLRFDTLMDIDGLLVPGAYSNPTTRPNLSLFALLRDKVVFRLLELIRRFKKPNRPMNLSPMVIKNNHRSLSGRHAKNKNRSDSKTQIHHEIQRHGVSILATPPVQVQALADPAIPPATPGPGLSSQSIQRYVEFVLNPPPDHEREQIQRLGDDLRKRREKLNLSRCQLAEQLGIEIELIVAAENGYGDLETARHILTRTSQMEITGSTPS